MLHRFRHIACSVAAISLSLLSVPGTAIAQSDTVQDVIDARLIVGTFARLCAAPDADPQSIRIRADERRWEVASVANLGAEAPLADNAWRTSISGGDGSTIGLTVYIQDGEDRMQLADCGLRFQGIPYAAMLNALDASALFEQEVPTDEMAGEALAADPEAVFCVTQYPMASRPHQIRLALQDDILEDGLLYITRSEDPALTGCPLPLAID